MKTLSKTIFSLLCASIFTVTAFAQSNDITEVQQAKLYFDKLPDGDEKEPDKVLLGKTQSVAFKFSMYPNPAKENLTINHPPFATTQTVAIYNIVGTLEKEQIIEASASTSTNIDINKLTRGIYLVRLMDTTLKLSIL